MNQALSPQIKRALENSNDNVIPFKVSQHQWIRVVCAAGLGLVISVVALAMMQSLISQRNAIASQDYDFNVVDFVRLKRDTSVESRERRLPEKPKPIEPTKQQPVAVNLSQDLSTQDFEFELPAMELPNNVTGGLRLGGLLSHGGGGSDSSVIPLVRIQPQYPRRAAMNGTQGEVLVSFTITPTGSVKDVSVVNAKPKGVFERAAKRAILKWKFKPKVVDGQPVSQQAQQKLVFKLNS